MHIDTIWPLLLEEVMDGHKADAKQDSIREKIASHVVLDGSAEQFLLNPRRKLSPIYASAELLWYLSRDRSADMICAYAPQYKMFCDEDGSAYGAYGDRIGDNLRATTAGEWYGDELAHAIALLQKRRASKKCVVSLWRPLDLVYAEIGRKKDIPCTISWQFIARGEQLHMVCSMRSNDMWKGFLYDCYVNTVIQRYVAASLGMTAGEYHHISGSMHLYERDMNKASEAIDCFDRVLRPHEPYHPSNNYWTDEELKHALSNEERYRSGTARNLWPLREPLQDAVTCCGFKWMQRDPRGEEYLIRSPCLRRGMKQFLKPKET